MRCVSVWMRDMWEDVVMHRLDEEGLRTAA